MKRLKSMTGLLLLAAAMLCLGACDPADGPPKVEKEKAEMTQLTDGVYAKIETTEGFFVIKLYEDKTPKAVENFIALAEGKKEYADPETGKMTKGRLYDNRKIYRVVPNKLFQTGAPNHNMTYKAGFKIEEEIRPELNFNGPWRVAMAGSGGNKPSVQFFVTCDEMIMLNEKYIIFGEVVQGRSAVKNIIATPVKPGTEEPVKMPEIKKVTIVRVGKTGGEK